MKDKKWIALVIFMLKVSLMGTIIVKWGSIMMLYVGHIDKDQRQV